MNTRRKSAVLFRIFIGVLSLVYVLGALGGHVSANQITARSLTLQAGTTDPGAKPSGLVHHFFQFTLPAVGDPNVGSIKFLYCTTASGNCDTPIGLNTTAATMGSQDGATGFSLNPTTQGAPYIFRASATQITHGTQVSYQLLDVTNPDGTSCGAGAPANNNCTFFVRISTYASTDTSGSPIDTGVVAASTSQAITLTGIMPESLIFCTGHTIGSSAGIPDCSTADSGAINFDRLFSPADTSLATSQMAASTNAGSGYSITVNGPTLTSGTNTITAVSSPAGSTHGLSQFGMNLVDNATPDVGADVTPASNGDNYKGEAAASYNAADIFKFATGNVVADSASGGAAGGTDAQIFTASYIVNVPGSQPAGTYTSTLTYICTATF